MDAIFPITLLIVTIAGIALIIREIRRRKAPEDGQSLLLIQNQVNELRRALDTKLGEIANESKHTIGEVTRQSAKIIGDVTEKLTRVDEAARQTLTMNE